MRTPRADESRPRRNCDRAHRVLRLLRALSPRLRIIGRMTAALLLAAILGASLSPVGATAQSGEDAAERAAREIQEARDRANAAAQAFLDAQSELETLGDEVLSADQRG